MIRTALIKEELMTYVRNKNVMLPDERGVHTKVVSKSAQATTSLEFGVLNIRKITNSVAGVLVPFRDYLMDYENSIITFRKTFTGVNEITYDWGESDRIYTDFSQADISVKSVPRIIGDVSNSLTKDIQIPPEVKDSEYIFKMSIYGTTANQIEKIISRIALLFGENYKGFKNFTYIKPMTMSELSNIYEVAGKVLSRSIDFIVWSQSESYKQIEAMEMEMDKVRKIGELSTEHTYTSDTDSDGNTGELEIDLSKYRSVNVKGFAYLSGLPDNPGNVIRGKMGFKLDGTEISSFDIEPINPTLQNDKTKYLMSFETDVQVTSDLPPQSLITVSSASTILYDKKGVKSRKNYSGEGTQMKQDINLSTTKVQFYTKGFDKINTAKLQARFVVTGVIR